MKCPLQRSTVWHRCTPLSLYLPLSFLNACMHASKRSSLAVGTYSAVVYFHNATRQSYFLFQLTTSRFRVWMWKPQANRWLAQKKDLLCPPHIYITFHTTDFSHISRNTACDSALSAAGRSVRHICSDSYDGCATETPASADTLKYGKL